MSRYKPHAIDLPVYDSLKACSKATGIPLAVIAQCKKGGCPAFRNSRVHLAELLPWLFKDHEGHDALNWGEEFKKWQAKREKLKYEKLADSLLDKAVVESAITRAQSIRFGSLERLLLSTLPPDLKGKDEHAIRARLSEVIEELRTLEAAELTAELRNPKDEEDDSQDSPHTTAKPKAEAGKMRDRKRPARRANV